LVNSANRIIVGLLILISVIIIYFFEVDLLLILIVSLLSFYDLVKSNIIKINYLYIYLLILIFLIFFSEYVSLYLILFVSLLSVFFFIFENKYRNISFVISITIFLYLFYFLSLNYRDLFYLIIFLSFLNDTSAYVFGNIIKGPLIAPSISPKKTWSGTVSSCMISFLFLTFYGFNIFVSILISISFFLGDLLFSYFKRNIGIKDFSLIFSSHGGILDRIDSMFLALIIINLYTLTSL